MSDLSPTHGPHLGVIPAKAGTQIAAAQLGEWVAAFAGMTCGGAGDEVEHFA